MLKKIKLEIQKRIIPSINLHKYLDKYRDIILEMDQYLPQKIKVKLLSLIALVFLISGTSIAIRTFVLREKKENNIETGHIATPPVVQSNKQTKDSVTVQKHNH